MNPDAIIGILIGAFIGPFFWIGVVEVADRIDRRLRGK